MEALGKVAAVMALSAMSATALAEMTLEERLAQAEQRLATLEQQPDQSAGLEDRVKINGFMTFAMERASGTRSSSGERLVFSENVRSDEWNMNSLTRAGVQFTGEINDRTEAVIQLLGRADEDFDAGVQWAYVSYELSPSLKARAGRLVLPFYLHSQYTQVGYAYNWVTLPEEMYSVIPLDTHEGIDLTWNVSTGPVANSINVFWGGMDVPANGLQFKVRDQYGANIRSNLGDWSLWYSYTNSRVSVDLAPLSPDPLFDPAFTALNMDEHYAYFTGVGLQYDNGSFFTMGEVGRLDLSTPNHWFPRLESAYVSMGYRIGKFTPQVTWASIDHSDFGDVDASNPVAPVIFDGFSDRQKSWTFTARYDLTPGVALKAEVTRNYDFGDSEYPSRGLYDSSCDVLTAGAGCGQPDDDDPLIYRFAVESVF